MTGLRQKPPTIREMRVFLLCIGILFAGLFMTGFGFLFCKNDCAFTCVGCAFGEVAYCSYIIIIGLIIGIISVLKAIRIMEDKRGIWGFVHDNRKEAEKP